MGNTFKIINPLILSLSINDIVDRVRSAISERDIVIEELYTNSNLCNSVYSYVLKNGGDEQEANDVFTFGIMTFIKQCYRPLFELSSSVEAYVFSISKYEWIRLSKRKMKVIQHEPNIHGEIEVSIENEIINRERFSMLKKVLEDLDEKCRKVLTLWSTNLKMREIAIHMDYKSEGMARKKKHECLTKLKSLIKDI